MKFLTPVYDKCYGCIVYPTCVVDCDMIKEELKKVDRNCKLFDYGVYLTAILIGIIGCVV